MDLKFFQKLEKFISYTIKLGAKSRNIVVCDLRLVRLWRSARNEFAFCAKDVASYAKL